MDQADDAQGGPAASPEAGPSPAAPSPGRGTLIDALLAAALVFVFVPALGAMAEVWRSVDYQSHGFLVPVVSLWAASAKRTELRKLVRGPDWRGAVGLVGALALYGLGLLAGVLFLQGLAMVGAVAFGVLARWGTTATRVLAFPLGYLVFMVPLPPTWLAPAVVSLQLLVSAMAVALVQRLGLPVLRDGNVIEIPGGETLFVAEACSGITSVVTLVPLAVFLAYFTERTTARRVVLVLAVLPLALVGNLIRVVGTVWTAARFGAEAALSGPLHEWAGLLTYALGCAALLALGAGMRWLAPERPDPARTT